MGNQQISFQLVRVKCGDETGGGFAEGLGNDEIRVAGVGMDATGATVMLSPFEIYAHFDDHEVKEFSPPQTLFTLAVPERGEFPKTCGVYLLLAEIDWGGFLEVTQSAHAMITEEIERRKQEMMGGSGNAAAIGPILAAIWAAVGPTVTDYVLRQIASGVSDDVFLPQKASVEVSSSDFFWGDGTKLSPEATVEFRGHGGVYYLTYFWEIQTIA